MKVRCYSGNRDFQQELRRWWNLIGGARRDRTDDLNTASVRKPIKYAAFRALGKLWVRTSIGFSTPYSGALSTYIDA